MTTPTALPLQQVIDAHINLASSRCVPHRFIAEQADNVFRRLAARGTRVGRDKITMRVFAMYEDHDADRLVAEMDACGIDKAMLVAPDFSVAEDCELGREELAAMHHRVCQRHPGRFGVFWGVDPRSGRHGVEHFESCVERFGFQGLKVYPINGYSPSDPRLYPYYEICAASRMPVLSHTGPGYQTLDFALGNPLLVDKAARDFPTVDFILGHGGARDVEQALQLCLHRPNVYFDLAGFIGALSTDARRARLNQMFRVGVSHKIIFGSDWSAYRMSHTLSSIIADFRGSAPVFTGVKNAHQRMIMGGNISRLLAATGRRSIGHSPDHPAPTGHTGGAC